MHLPPTTATGMMTAAAPVLSLLAAAARAEGRIYTLMTRRIQYVVHRSETKLLTLTTSIIVWMAKQRAIWSLRCCCRRRPWRTRTWQDRWCRRETGRRTGSSISGRSSRICKSFNYRTVNVKFHFVLFVICTGALASWCKMFGRKPWRRSLEGLGSLFSTLLFSRMSNLVFISYFLCVNGL